MGYKKSEIEKELGYEFEEKCIVCDTLPLAELRKLLLDGWVIYDTRPEINTNNVKYLTLLKVNQDLYS